MNMRAQGALRGDAGTLRRALTSFIAAGCVSVSCTSTTPSPAPPSAAPASTQGLAPSASPAAPPAAGTASPAPPVVDSPQATAPAECRDKMRGLKHAFAIPHGDSGTIELVLTNHPTTCTYWTDPTFEDRCDVWRARINLPAGAQRPGRYRVEQSFAYLDRKATGPKGAWQSAGACEQGGGNLTGEIEILAITQNTIEARLCGTETEDHRNGDLVSGAFVAQRCPACAMTGSKCSTDADCCTGNCGSRGHCGP